MTRNDIIVKIDPDLKELIPGFLKNRNCDIINCKKALESNDMEQIRIIGHNLKGLGSSYGFDPISQLGLVLEESALNHDSANIAYALNKLEDYLNNVCIIYP